MGQPKQLLPLGGQPMLRRVAEAACAAQLAQVVVVIGAAADRVQEAVAGLGLHVVYNAEWEQGMSTSLRAGISALRQEIEAALVILADHPGLSPGLIGRLVECYRESGASMVAPAYRGRRGHPVLLARSCFADLLRLAGDEGARSLLRRPGADLVTIEVDDEAIVQDVDTWQDYARAGGTRSA